MIGKFPVAVLDIEIDPQLMDINVHPTKLEVKFANEKDVRNAVYYGVKNALYALPNVPEISRVDEETGEILFEREESGKQLDLSEMVNELPKNVKEYPKKTASSVGLSSRASYGKENKLEVSEASVPQTVGLSVDENIPTVKKVFSDILKNDLNTSEKPQKDISDTIIKESKKDDTNNKKGEETSPENDITVSEPTERVPHKRTEYKAEYVPEPQSAVEKYEFLKKISDGEIKPSFNDASVDGITDDEEPEEEQKNIFIDEYFRVAGQIFDTYIVVEKDDKMLLIDQHAAHERLKYEELKREMAANQVMSQMLLEPVIVRLSAPEFSAFEECREALYNMGFECDAFGDSEIIVRGVPGELEEGEVEELIISLITNSAKAKQELSTESRDRMLYTIACKAAIKANHRLSTAEMETLVRNVFRLRNINTCPHGRPIVITMSRTEIEKEFKRIT
jgi:DNA mismatch repair protein MutL